MTGVRARVGLAIDAIGIKCRTVQANGSLGNEINVGTMVGGSGGSAITNGSCASGSVISSQIGTGLGLVIIGYLKLGWFQWTASTRSVSRTFTGNVVVLAPPAYAVPFSAAGCFHATQPARAIEGRAGTLVDAVGLICNEP